MDNNNLLNKQKISDNLTKVSEPKINPITDYGKGLAPDIDSITDYGKGLKPDVDLITDYGKGLAPDVDLITDYGKGLKPDVDLITDYGKGLAPDIDSITNFGNGISFKSVDGREWATMEQAEAVNRAYYESLIIKNQNNIKEEPRYHR